MSIHDPKYLKWLERQGQSLPSHDAHGFQDTYENPLSEQLRKYRVKPRSWKLEGNLLTADTEQGPIRQKIPVDYCLTGEVDGLPQFKKIELQ